MRVCLSVLRVSSLFLLAGLFSIPVQATGGDGKETDQLPLGNTAWDLKIFDLDPVRFVKATYDPEKQAVKFVLEFSRDLRPADFEWDKNTPPYTIRFLDADGVALKSFTAHYEGDVIRRQGRRFRLLLDMPNAMTDARAKGILEKTRIVVVEK
jgi:hypothetical protein